MSKEITPELVAKEAIKFAHHEIIKSSELISHHTKIIVDNYDTLSEEVKTSMSWLLRLVRNQIIPADS